MLIAYRSFSLVDLNDSNHVYIQVNRKVLCPGNPGPFPRAGFDFIQETEDEYRDKYRDEYKDEYRDERKGNEKKKDKEEFKKILCFSDAIFDKHPFTETTYGVQIHPVIFVELS